MLDRDALEAQLRQDHELPEFEVKGPGSPDDADFMAKVARAALGLANLQDGGHIIIGIGESDLAKMSPGLTDEQFTAWSNYDVIADKLCQWGDPPLKFDRQAITLSSGAKVVVLQIDQFVDEPHLCAKNNDNAKLHKGRLYIRPRRGRPQTAEVSTSAEMRDLLDLALTWRLRRFNSTIERAQLQLSGSPTDDQQYAQELNDALAHHENGDLSNRPHYLITVHPADRFEEDRIDYGALQPLLERCVVRMRGWPLPMIDDRDGFQRGQRWMGSVVDVSGSLGHAESWLMFQSGQFTTLRGVSADRRHGPDEAAKIPAGFQHVVEYWDILFVLTETVELAARLSLQLDTPAPMTVQFSVQALKPQTTLGNSTRVPAYQPIRPQPAPTSNVEVKETFTLEQLTQPTAVLALALARSIFQRFGWDPSLQQLQVLQRELTA